MDEGHTHAHTPQTQREGPQRPGARTHTVSPSVSEPPAHGTVAERRVGVNPQMGRSRSVAGPPPDSQLVHDAVRLVGRGRAVLPQTPPLEGRAERADLVLLVLLLLGEVHEHLRDKEAGQE